MTVTLASEKPIVPVSSPVTDRDRLEDEARMVGLRDFETPTLEAVERRRVQLWIVSLLILLGASAVMAVASYWPTVAAAIGAEWLDLSALRIGMLALTVGFAAYIIEKERALRRLTRLLIDERVLTAALSNRLAEVTALLEAGKAINSVLELDSVLNIILGSATSLLAGEGGSIMLLEGSDRLKSVCVMGNDEAIDAIVPFDHGIAGRVARSREPLLITGRMGGRRHPVDSAMCVPLLHRDELLGVLNVNGSGGRAFTEYDLRALSLFAEHAATAIGNARLYEAERRQVRDLVDLENRKTEFLAAVSHDLRTPLTSLIGCTKMLMRDRLPETHRLELAGMVDRQAVRLKRMIEDLLATARLEHDAPPELEAVDIHALVDELGADMAACDKPFAVIDQGCPRLVLGTTEGLRRALTNLIDNAFAYGAPPVTVTLSHDAAGPVLSVLDSGPGISRADRERVFERFCRLDTARQKSGIGLGLSIVRGLVAGCGGLVWVDDSPGGGAAFHVRLQPAPD